MMSKTRVEQMLQECLDGYEAGLTPEECLSAFPASRAALEPLLRQALSLRVAYACSPSDEFRHRTREQLMFAAGRDVAAALTSEPDPNFILQERTRFLNVAGAAAQEALRDVPPPRLAFWVNARRRLLEAAARPAPARRFGLALRYTLSVAAVAAVIAVAALVPFGGGGNSPATADAQLAALEEQITRVELLTQQGQAVSAAELDDLADRTSQITNTLNEFDLERAEKIGGLIIRQQEVVKQLSADEPQLVDTQQKLAEAQQKLDSAKGSPTAAAAAVIETTGEPDVVVTQEPEPVSTPEPLLPGEVRTELAPDDEYGLTWQRVTTNYVSFVMPDAWSLRTVEEDQNGVLFQTISAIGIATNGEPSIMIIVTQDGETIAYVSGLPLTLRGPGVAGATIPAEALAELGEIGPALHHFVLSISTNAGP